MKESEKLELELKALLQQNQDLKEEKNLLEAKLMEVTKAIKNLHGSFSFVGEIQILKGKIEQAKRAEADEHMPFPVWISTGSFKKNNVIISRIAPKRIFLREKGSEVETYYDKETGKHGKYVCDGVLDVPATIAVWEAKKV